MINYHTEVVAALKTVLPTHHELVLHSGLKTPCISYQEGNNYITEQGDTIDYSVITYQVKIWDNDIARIQGYVVEVDKALRKLGFMRISTGELADKNSTMIQKIMTYSANAREDY